MKLIVLSLRKGLLIGIAALTVFAAIGVAMVASSPFPVLADEPQPTALPSLPRSLRGRQIVVEPLQDPGIGVQGGLKIGEARLGNAIKPLATPDLAQAGEGDSQRQDGRTGAQALAKPASALMSEGFEGTWPASGWQLYDLSQTDNGEYAMGKRNCHPHTGSYGGWTVGGGSSGSALGCSGSYPNNAYTMAAYGPFDLSSATAASLTFYVWGKSQPPANGVCSDGMFWGSTTAQDFADFAGQATCGDGTGGPEGNGYYKLTYDLSSRLGAPQVWIAVGFFSDASVTNIGFTVDDVQLDVTGSNTYGITGRVAVSGGSAVSGVTISDNAGHSATTDASGNYTLSGLAAGSYTVTPAKSGCTFAPSSLSVSVPPSRSGQDFVATCTTNPPPTPGPNAVVNGDFEQGRGAGWTESSMQWHQLVKTGSAHGGTWLAELGDGASGSGGESAQIYQTVSVPAGSAGLTYWYKITSAGGCSYSKAAIILGTWTLKEYPLCATTATGGWVQETVNLAEYAGQTLKLTFFVKTEFGGGTTFYVDDVVVSQGAPVTPPTPEPSESIVNGDFESGPSIGWSRSSIVGLALIAQGTSHGGSWRAVLGNSNHESAAIAQTVRIPAAGATLEYWYKISSEDVCANDRGFVYVSTDPSGSGTTELKKYVMCTSSATSSYVLDEVSLVAYAGQTVTLSFRAVTDGTHPSTFYVDDVVLRSSGGSSYSIAGRVMAGGSGLAGTTVSDGAGHSATTDASGAYTLSGLAAGSYTVTAAKSGCTFTPGSRAVSVPPSASGQDFTGTCTASTYTVSGRVTAGGSGLSGVTISDGAGHSATTDASGAYTLSGLAAGSYTVTAAKSGCTLTPGSRAVSVPPSASGQDFTASCGVSTYTISGQVSNSASTALAGATVSVTGATNASTTSGSDGRYTLGNLPAGTYSVSASKAGYAASAAQSVTLPPNASNVNFVLQVQAGCGAVPSTAYFTSYNGEAVLNGQPVSVGMIVEAFSPRGDRVGCFQVNSAGLYGYMRVYGEDASVSPAIPGMRANEDVTFKINGTQARPSTCPVKWTDDKSIHRVDLTSPGACVTDQKIDLHSGLNWFSIARQAGAADPASVLSTISGKYSLVMSEDQTYAPPPADPRFNTLTSLVPGNGYMIRMNQGASLTVTGSAVAANSPLTLVRGLRWLGYLPERAIDVPTALASISGKFSLLMGETATYAPPPADPRFNDLVNMEPGRGYLIRMTQDGTLTYPATLAVNASPRQALADREQATEVQGCSVSATPYFTQYYGQVTVDGQPAPVGALVEAISPRGDPVGCYQVANTGLYGYMRVYGEDATISPSIPGMRAGETVRFKVNGRAAEVTGIAAWQDDKTIHSVNLAAHKEGYRTYLPRLER